MQPECEECGVPAMDQGVFDAFLCETHYREAISIDQADNAVKYLKEEADIRKADLRDLDS